MFPRGQSVSGHVIHPFVSDTSLKRIDREGLGKRRTGTRQPVSKDGQDYDEMIEEIDPVVKETETFQVPKTSPDEEAADMVYNFKKVNKSFSRR